MAQQAALPMQPGRAARWRRGGLVLLAVAGLLGGCATSAAPPAWYRTEPLPGPTQRYDPPADSFRA